jgi:EAL domain-containing protein (putative c-di-GMP-specific phosphodiesterase class I)
MASPAAIPPANEPAAPLPFELLASARLPLAQKMDLAAVRALLDEGRFSTAYEPIVHARTGRTAAFEALARFRRPDGQPIAPDRVFSLLHADPALLLRTELTVKLHQVEHAPPRTALFVNLDPDCWARAGGGETNPFLALLGSARNRVVVEVTEAVVSADAHRAVEMIAALRRRGIAAALDDIGVARSVLCFEALAEARVLKFDRTLIPRLRHPRYRAIVLALVRMAREAGGHTVLEGVETTADFVLARDLGVDLVQGYLFRDRCRVAGR